MSGPCALPSGGAPLLDTGIIQKIQAALIPKQMPQTVKIIGDGLHGSPNRSMCDISRCVTSQVQQLRCPTASCSCSESCRSLE